MRLRLFLSFFLIVLISVASMVVVARQSAAQEVRALMLRGGMTDIDAVVDSLEDYYRTHQTWQGVASLLWTPGGRGMGRGGMMAGMMDQRILLADAGGTVVFDSEGGGSQASGRLSEAQLAEASPLRSGLDTVGYLLVEGGMGFTLDDEQLLLGRLSQAALTAGVIAGGVSLLIALFLAYHLLRPVRDLTSAAANLAAGDLTQRVPVRGGDEMAVLARTFNHMAESLRWAEESRRAMTADIAHELRNPLAVQRANLEALQDGIYPLTPENLEPILQQNHLLSRLVEDLRTLALADAGQLALERVPTDLPALVQRVIDRFEPQAASRQIKIRFDHSPNPLSPTEAALRHPLLSIDPLRVEQIINNLLSNALRYTPDGGQINLDLLHTQEAAHLTVRDSGPGIPQEALPHIFERFYRAERSRSRREGGTGLGLAIARQLARAHGGELTATNHPEGGAVFTLTFPIFSKEAMKQGSQEKEFL